MFVGLGSHDRLPQTGWLQQRTFIFSQFWGLEVQGQGAVRLVSGETSLPDLQMDNFSSYPNMVFPQCIFRDRQTDIKGIAMGQGKKEGRINLE